MAQYRLLHRSLRLKPAFTKGPLGFNDCADPNWGGCFAGPTSGPVGLGDGADPNRFHLLLVPRQRPPVLLLDTLKVYDFLRAVAVAKAQHRFIKVKWDANKDAAVKGTLGAFGAVYDLITEPISDTVTKAPNDYNPGYSAVEPGDYYQIRSAADEDTRKLIDDFLVNVARGPASAQHYLRAQEQIRQSNLNAIQELYATVKELNREGARAAVAAVESLAVLRFVNLVAEKVLCIRMGFLLGVAYDLAYGIVPYVVEAWDEIEIAKIKVILFINTMEAAGEGTKRIGEKIDANAEKAVARAEQLASRLRELQRRLAQQVKKAQVGKKIRRAMRQQTAEAESALKSSARSSALRGIGKAVNVGFIAYELLDGFSEMLDTVRKAEAEAQ